jgi:hypothetical protein
MIACAQVPVAPVHVIEVLADKDSRYKIAGEKKPEISVKAGEQILLRITARKGKSWNRDGVDTWILAASRQGSGKSIWLGFTAEAGHAGFSDDRSRRTGRIRCSVYRNLQ